MRYFTCHHDPEDPQRLEAPVAAQIIDDLAHRHVHAPAASDVLAAIDIHQQTGASFWDAMILRSAKELGCQILYSKDLNAARDYAGVDVRNHSGPNRPRHRT